MPYYQKALTRPLDLEFLSKVLQPRVETLGDIENQIAFLEKVEPFAPSLYENKKMKTDAEVAKNTLALALESLKSVDEWTNDNLFAALKETAEKAGVKNGQILYPVRIALSGKETTAGGATEIAVVLGKEETLQRIENALKSLM